MQPVPNFTHFTTHHCASGSLREIYAFHGHPASEELLLGLGQGVGFGYWHWRGSEPFLGGRAMPRPSMEVLAGRCTGVEVRTHTTRRTDRAAATLVKALEAGQPVMLQVDMGYLPYFDFGGEEYHFGGHAIVACGWDAAAQTVLIADRDADLHPVPMPDLIRARSSQHKPFPPRNRWWSFDFSAARSPRPAEVWTALEKQAHIMTRPPIRNLGVRGIEKAASAIPDWPKRLDAEGLRRALFNGYIFVSAEGGTGGGCFRHMFSRFLTEAATITGVTDLQASAEAFAAIGARWDDFAAWCRAASEAPDPAARLPEATAPLQAIAALEADAWGAVLALAQACTV